MAKTGAMSVAELEKLLAQAKKEIQQLQTERGGLVARLAEIDSRLAELGAPRKRRAKAQRGAEPKAKKPGRKPGRKKMTLAQHVEKLLGTAREPISPKEMAQALKAKGVSKAKTLAMQVNQVLRSDKVAARKVGRGRYVSAQGG